MLTFLRKFRVLIICSLLAVYLAATFQSLVLEGLHQTAHTLEALLQSSNSHSPHEHHYHQHGQPAVSTHSHTHPTLDLLHDLFDAFADDDHPPVEDAKKDLKKKNPELLLHAGPVATVPEVQHRLLIPYVCRLRSFLPTVPAPPPKAIASFYPAIFIWFSDGLPIGFVYRY